jgi:SAM-dependent methyltransferase
MTPADRIYIEKLLAKGLIKSPCLELGTGYGGDICKEMIKAAGIEYYGTDMFKSEHVDYVANFDDDIQTIKDAFNGKKFNTILTLNVLEHTYNPIEILDKTLQLLNENGNYIIVTPTVWQLHDYPIDTWRINPNFYEEYAKRNSLTIPREYFEYVGHGKIDDYKDTTGKYTYKYPDNPMSKFKKWRSRVIHKLFDTAGREMFFSNFIAIGCVFSKNGK